MEPIDAERLGDDATLGELVSLLVAVVDDGGSLGFLAPLASADADSYWRATATPVAAGDVHLLVARERARIVGSVQLQLSPWPDGPHRAELAKLMVSPSHRRRGVATALMQAVEQTALHLGRTLLTLNTRVGDPSELLYRSRGYTRYGVVPRYLTDGQRLHDKSHWYRELAPAD